jgi:nucleotide-binding universal stress UspA family protein
MKRKILVAVDFSELSDKALLQAYSLCRKLEKDMHLVHIVEEHSSIFNLFSKEHKEEFFVKIGDKLGEIARNAEKKINGAVTWEVQKGKPYIHVLEIAKKVDPAFIIMGVRGEHEHDHHKNFVGNNTSKIIRSSQWPVITVSKKVTCTNLRSILLPLDLTKETRQKVSQAIELAKKFNAEIKVVSALWSKKDKSVIQGLKQQIVQVVNFIRKENVKCSGEIVESSEDASSLVPIILKYADQHEDIDMILIMTQQEIGLVEYFIGSTALELLKKSSLPVMSILPKELGRSSMINF